MTLVRARSDVAGAHVSMRIEKLCVLSISLMEYRCQVHANLILTLEVARTRAHVGSVLRGALPALPIIELVCVQRARC